MFPAAALLSLVALAPFVTAGPANKRADSPEWGQCGGIGWSGPTTCVAGNTCVKINDYYYQCIKGAAPPVTTVTPTSSTAPTVTPTSSTAPTPTGTPGTPSASNPYTGYEVYLSPYYAAEVRAAAAAITNPTLAARALKVASIPTFIWFDVIAKVPTLGTYLKDALAIQNATGKKQLVQIVVYDLPDRDCAALASNGEFSIADGGDANYKRYVDGLIAQIKLYPEIRVVAVVEPDSLANLITNLNVPKCSGAQDSYKSGVIYALQKLSSVGVYSYIDAGHAGWLGWTANLPPAAALFASIYKAAGSSPYIKGIATNVSNYNALRAATPDPITQGNSNYDEIHYVDALGPALAAAGFPATFIVDQGRSGVQNIRVAWGNWCNVKGAGFGTRPTISTGSSLIDAIVWIKPGGEADGTSDQSSVRYDGFCGKPDAFIPAPEAGTWFQAYFEMLVTNSNPAL